MTQTDEQKKIAQRLTIIGLILFILLEVFVFYLIEKNMKAFMYYHLGIFVSLVLGHYVTKNFVLNLKKHFNMPGGGDNAVTKWLGHFERFAISAAIVINHFEFIPFWLAFKVLGRWAAGHTEEQGKHATDIFFLGNLISIIFGVLGGLIISEGCFEVALILEGH